MMGVPPSEYATVFRCSNVILSNGDPEYIPEDADPVLAFINAGQELTDLMNELGAYRIDHPDRRPDHRPRSPPTSTARR